MLYFVRIFNASFAAFLILGILSFTSPKYAHSLSNTVTFQKLEPICYEGTDSKGIYIYATLTFKDDDTFVGGLAASDGSSTEISGRTDGSKIYLNNGGEWTIHDGYVMTGNGVHLNQITCK